MNVVKFPTSSPSANAAADHYELVWSRGKEVMAVSCSSADQILRQMNSLAKSKSPATLYKNGSPWGWVGPQKVSRVGGPFQAYILMPD